MSSKPIDWSQLWYPGPLRAFSADELARAGSDPPSPTLLAVAAINVASVVFFALQMAPARDTARIAGVLVALVAIGFGAARWLWWHPARLPLLLAVLAVMVAVLGMAFGIRWRLPERSERESVFNVLGVGGGVLPLLLWFLVLWRAQQIEGRLNEQAEREKAIEMARRLAAAQLEPHFLFNTLASLQHWVQTQDERAAPLLAALTGYLRATLPMFHRPLLAAGDELLAIERYLQVMQARLGAARLQWTIDVDAAARAADLPPGLLLTLVENAVAHGIEPLLGGGRISLHGSRHGDELRFEVHDNGPGPASDMREGVGLANARQRLALTCGPSASLSIEPAAGGGCRAEIVLPYNIAQTVP